MIFYRAYMPFSMKDRYFNLTNQITIFVTSRIYNIAASNLRD